MSKKITKAINRIARARSELAAARKILANETKPGSAPCLIDSEWQWAVEMLEKKRAYLLSIAGVVGCSLGFREKGGVRTTEPCISVFVRRKYREGTLEKKGVRTLPRFFRSGNRTLPIDVIQLGKIKRHLGAGASIGPTHKKSKGTLGAFAEDAGGDVMALTAMHVAGIRSYPTAAGRLIEFCWPSRKDNPSGEVFGKLRIGSRDGIDAAAITLYTPSDGWPALPAIGPIKGWRPTLYPGDFGTPVRMYGAVSKFQQGRIINPFVSIPEERLDAVILSDISTQKGDSGAALIDPEGLVLGLLVGGYQNSSVFCSISSILARFACEIMILE